VGSHLRHQQLLTSRGEKNVEEKLVCFGNLGTKVTSVFTKVRSYFEDVKPSASKLDCVYN
jgi:hypothetical protein